MISQATVISLAESNPSIALTVSVPPSVYKGKLEPLIKSAKAKGQDVAGKSQAALESALVQSLKSGDQANIDWVLQHNVWLK